MRNLLPEEYRKHLENEYHLRVIVVVLVLVLITALVGIVLLLPSYFLSRAKEKSVNEQAMFIDRSIALSEERAPVELFRVTRERLDLVANDRNRPLLLIIIKNIVDDKVSKIVLSNITYERTGEGATLTLLGEAESREDLLVFKEKLDRNNLFSNVSLPVSDLAKSKDIKFTLTLETPLEI